MKLVRFVPFLLCSLLFTIAPALAEPLAELQVVDVIAVDGIADQDGLSPAADLSSFTLRNDEGIFVPRADKGMKGIRRLVSDPWRITIEADTDNGQVDTVQTSFPADKAIKAHCAFVLHGNLGIGYSDVLHGRQDDLEGSGFDEALQAHQNNNIPGNFHMSGTLMTAT